MTELSDQLAIDRYNELLASHDRLRVALETVTTRLETAREEMAFLRGEAGKELDALADAADDADIAAVGTARKALKLIPKGE